MLHIWIWYTHEYVTHINDITTQVYVTHANICYTYEYMLHTHMNDITTQVCVTHTHQYRYPNMYYTYEYMLHIWICDTYESVTHINDITTQVCVTHWHEYPYPSMCNTYEWISLPKYSVNSITIAVSDAHLSNFSCRVCEVCVTWPIYVHDMLHAYVRHDSFIFTSLCLWHIRRVKSVRCVTHINATWMRRVTHAVESCHTSECDMSRT